MYDCIGFVNKILYADTENRMIKILIVDDDVQVTTLLRKYLSPKKFEVAAINQSSKAIQMADLMRPDLFILDLMMPPPDGFELCRILRADPGFVRTPILLTLAQMTI